MKGGKKMSPIKEKTAFKVLLVSIFFLALAVPAIVVSQAQAQARYSLATSPLGGAWYSMASALAELFNKNIPNVTFTVDGSGGASVNPKKLASKQADMAMQTLDMVYAAKDGTPPYKEKLDMSNVRSIILQHSSPGHIVVLKKSSIKSIADLKGKRVSVGERGAAGNQRVYWYFEVYGLGKDDVKVEYIGDDQAADALSDGKIDAMIEFVGAPAPAILNLAATADVRFITLEPSNAQKLRQKWPFMVPTAIKAGTYKGQTEDYVAYGVPGTLMVTTDMPENIVYLACKAIDQNRDFLSKVHILFNAWKFDKDLETISGQPLHAGALKFYKEKKIIQ
jgi:uncharacterized protein